MTRQPINTILFDLDGTLLPLDQDQFIQDYFSRFVIKGQELGYSPELLLAALQRGITAMVLNDGSLTNKERFDRVFEEASGIAAAEFNERFAPFYEHEFGLLRRHASPSLLAREIVQEVKRKGYTVVLATNPLFPWQGTEARLGWAYLASSQFSLVTTYEDFHYAKPNLGYYRQILQTLGKEASSCLMVGNDVEEDMVARELGMEVYLVTDYLINKSNRSIQGYRNSSFEQLYCFCKNLPRIM
ncbi:HAD family hydrolase [uncultured Sphaerochaeta sp.]|uniref:HAD family hydrolase n=1 Tax=uncultured Sphaerochaeta sp. TaxID=886478 RepID=UPI002A0A63E3|nr:HAD family hydrolase [uncultured Sphaerochaeta sp.]